MSSLLTGCLGEQTKRAENQTASSSAGDHNRPGCVTIASAYHRVCCKGTWSDFRVLGHPVWLITGLATKKQVKCLLCVKFILNMSGLPPALMLCVSHLIFTQNKLNRSIDGARSSGDTCLQSPCALFSADDGRSSNPALHDRSAPDQS